MKAFAACCARQVRLQEGSGRFPLCQVAGPLFHIPSGRSAGPAGAAGGSPALPGPAFIARRDIVQQGLGEAPWQQF